MKLFLMRHATTEKPGAKKDIERILTPQGQNEAAQAALFLKNYSIDKALVSYATRTIQTLKVIQEQCEIAEIESVMSLYHKTEEESLELITCQHSANKQILVIGHNPVIYHMAMILADKNSSLYDKLIRNNLMAPAHIIVLHFAHINSWQDLRKDTGIISDLFTPTNML